VHSLFVWLLRALVARCLGCFYDGNSGEDSGGNSGLLSCEVHANQNRRMIPQTHGGRLLKAGKAGNRGGTGAPPSAIRALCRESFSARITIAEQIADDESLCPRDRLKALELLARIGIGALDSTPVSDTDATEAAVLSAGGSRMEAFAATFGIGAR
jgi:hypothetical protein